MVGFFKRLTRYARGGVFRETSGWDNMTLQTVQGKTKAYDVNISCFVNPELLEGRNKAEIERLLRRVLHDASKHTCGNLVFGYAVDVEDGVY